jgi:hypothetical protein
LIRAEVPTLFAIFKHRRKQQISEQPISELLLWDHAEVVRCKCAKRVSSANYSRQLLKAIGKVDGLVTSAEEVGELTLDREAWRSGLSVIVKENNSSDSERCRTRREVIVLYYLIILRDIFSRLFVQGGSQYCRNDFQGKHVKCVLF